MIIRNVESIKLRNENFFNLSDCNKNSNFQKMSFRLCFYMKYYLIDNSQASINPQFFHNEHEIEFQSDFIDDDVENIIDMYYGEFDTFSFDEIEEKINKTVSN